MSEIECGLIAAFVGVIPAISIGATIYYLRRKRANELLRRNLNRLLEHNAPTLYVRGLVGTVEDYRDQPVIVLRELK